MRYFDGYTGPKVKIIWFEAYPTTHFGAYPTTHFGAYPTTHFGAIRETTQWFLELTVPDLNCDYLTRTYF